MGVPGSPKVVACLLPALCLVVLACSGAKGSAQPPKASAAPGAASPAAGPAPAASAAPKDSASKPPPDPGKPCGALDCLAFTDPEHAFERVLAENPRVLSVGEAHAQRSAPGVHSATRRFGERLLPHLRGRATDIVIELMVATGRCGKQREEAVAERQKPVTEPQAKTNQNEFVTLGVAAKRLSIEPHALEPTCDEYQAVLDAGEGDIARLLSLVADTTERAVEKLLAEPGGETEKVVVTYGGALHNDAAPGPEREAWSFGPRLEKRTNGRYVELDLIVPEFIKDTDSWRALPWYPHYDPARDGGAAVLFRPGPRSFVLIFPRSANPPPAPPL